MELAPWAWGIKPPGYHRYLLGGFIIITINTSIISIAFALAGLAVGIVGFGVWRWPFGRGGGPFVKFALANASIASLNARFQVIWGRLWAEASPPCIRHNDIAMDREAAKCIGNKRESTQTEIRN